ncbi:Carboxylic ester hydrolase [Aphelenchoides bicaudatus]|nr:Carboxylic ester hydrolase [Aphelenchoides bicaudatus]
MEKDTTAPTKLKSYLTGIAMVLLTLGLAFILAYIFNSSGVPSDSANLVTIHGEDRNYNIDGRRLLLSEGNYFTGIQYAKAPKLQTGKLVSLPHSVKATTWPNECPSLFYRNKTSADKCLNLNVYQCTSMQDKYLPVLVYINEGENNWDSSANLDANQVINNLACKGMIVVSVHYRSSIFGSFSFQEPSPTWVNKNIKHFNGDSNQITAMGSRKGAQIVSYLSQIPKTRAFFSQMILIGGAVDDPICFQIIGTLHINKFTRWQGVQTAAFEDEDPETMNKVELEDLIRCMRDSKKQAFFRFDQKLRLFWDKWPIDTSDLIGRESTKPINAMLGTCRNPPPKSSKPAKLINKARLEEFLNKNRDFNRTHNSEAFLKHYLNRYSNSSLTAPKALQQTKYDFTEVGPLLLEAHRLSALPNSSVFMFNLETESTRHDYTPEIKRKIHEQITPCLEHLLFRKVPANDLDLQKFMADSIANFVVKGNPNKVNGTDLKWAEFNATTTLNTYNVLNVNAKGIEVVENWETNSARFWLCERDQSKNATTSAYCS